MLIHLIAPQNKDKWPEAWKHCFQYWKNSSYNIKFWNDEEDVDNILKKDDLDFFNLINQLPKQFKLDYVRPILLEKYGGMYIDMDIEIIFDFIPMLNKNINYIMGGHKNDINDDVQNSILISSNSQINFWKELKHYYNYNIRKNFDDCKEPYSRILKGQIVGETVGSVALSKFISFYKNYYNIEILDANYFNRGNNTIRFSYHHQTHFWKKDFDKK
jgi:mannosyltransferase OCH1-like enzyme